MNKIKKNYHFYLYGPNEKIIDKVIEILPKNKLGKLLDVGAGTGLLCQKATNLGFQTFACDIQRQDFKAINIPFKKGDLNNKLPYQNSLFDFVTCTEVIEHLKNPWQSLNEIARVTKKNGCLVISLPNFTNLISRLVFFTRGNFRYFDDWTWDNWGHINPITFTELEKILKFVGFKIEKIDTQEKIGQPYASFLLIIHKVITTIFHIFKMIRWQKDPKDKILGQMESESLLLGENLILKCRKV